MLGYESEVVESLILLGSRLNSEQNTNASTAVSAGNICLLEKEDIEMRFLRSVSDAFEKM